MTTRDDFPETNDEILNRIWEEMAYPAFRELVEAKVVVDSLKPPHKKLLWETVKSNTDNPMVSKDLLALRDLKEAISEIEERLETWAASQFPEFTDQQRKEARQRFNTIRKGLIAHLESIKLHAEHLKETNVVDFIDLMLEEVRFTPVQTMSTSEEERTWLRERGFNVKDKGRIPKDLHLEWLQNLEGK